MLVRTHRDPLGQILGLLRHGSGRHAGAPDSSTPPQTEVSLLQQRPPPHVYSLPLHRLGPSLLSLMLEACASGSPRSRATARSVPKSAVKDGGPAAMPGVGA